MKFEDLNPKENPEHYWDYLGYMEASAIEKNNDTIKPWDETAKKCMTLAILAPLLKGEKSSEDSVKLAAAFLKRSMTDFRSIWLMLNWGYPYQAACVASSLYENSLVVNCIVDRNDLARTVMNAKNGDIPWGAQKLAKMAAEKDLMGEITDKPENSKEYEQAWKLCYRNYKWLCKIKHPTIQQLNDETNHAKVDDGRFAVIPLPDTRDSGVGLKQMIMIIAVSRLFSAAKNFAMAIKCPDDDKEHIKFFNLTCEVFSELKDNISKSSIKDLPIQVYDYKI